MDDILHRLQSFLDRMKEGRHSMSEKEWLLLCHEVNALQAENGLPLTFVGPRNG